MVGTARTFECFIRNVERCLKGYKDSCLCVAACIKSVFTSEPEIKSNLYYLQCFLGAEL